MPRYGMCLGLPFVVVSVVRAHDMAHSLVLLYLPDESIDMEDLHSDLC